MKKLIITSGTGFLGEVLIKHFQSQFDEIVILSRTEHDTKDNVRYALWDGKTLGNWKVEFTNVNTIINLTGKSVDCRYNQKNKDEILASRLNSTRVIAEAIKESRHKPALWINAASATIYNASLEKAQTEERNDVGDDFSMTVCKEWEKCFFSFTGLAERMIVMRISIVFGNEGGVYPVISSLAKKGLAGKQGSGKQMVSWVHTKDFANMVEWIMKTETKNTIYNCCSPNPITNKELMLQLKEKHKPLFSISTPVWAIKLGAIMLRTEAELVLKSRYIIPERALNEGFQFTYPVLKEALKNLN